MSSFNPYEVLDVPKDADEALIKAAFRRRSKETHPDVNGTGSDIEFKMVASAYKVLMDKEARAFFDQTGAMKEKGKLSPQEEMAKMIIIFFDVALQQCFEGGVRLVQGKIIPSMIEAMEHGIHHVDSEIDMAISQVKEMNEVKADIVRDGEGDNIFVKRLSKHIEDREEVLQKASMRKATLTMAIAELRKYKSVKDMMKGMWSSYGSAYNSSSDWFGPR